MQEQVGSGADRGSDTLLGPRQAGARDSLEQIWPRPGAAGVGKSGGGEPAARPPGRAGEEREAEAQRLQGGPCLRPGCHPKCSGRGLQKEVTASLEAPVGARGNDGCSSPP